MTKAISLVVTALNAFPLFELMLRVKEPSRLPGASDVHGRYTDRADGVYFTVKTDAMGLVLELHVSTRYKRGAAAEEQNAPRSFADILWSRRP